jgi:hypothetical protein
LHKYLVNLAIRDVVAVDQLNGALAEVADLPAESGVAKGYFVTVNFHLD